MNIEHDEDDPPHVHGPVDFYWGWFNRFAEQCAAVARAWGLLR